MWDSTWQHTVTTKTKFPNGPHWAILTYSTIHVPGDERSRTNPGHGYPASNEAIVRYTAFSDEDKWREAIRNHEIAKIPYNAMRVIPAVIATNIQIDVGYGNE